MILASWHSIICGGLGGGSLIILYWYTKLMWSQFKFFSPAAEKRLRLSDPRGRPANWRNGYRAD